MPGPVTSATPTSNIVVWVEDKESFDAFFKAFYSLIILDARGLCMCIQKYLWPAAGIIGCPFDVVHQFSANSRFCVGTSEFTFDLLQWIIEQYSGRFLVLDENWQLTFVHHREYSFLWMAYDSSKVACPPYFGLIVFSTWTYLLRWRWVQLILSGWLWCCKR